MKTLIRGGTVYDENAGEVLDVLIEGGKISRVGRELPVLPGAKIIDAAGLAVVPGFMDFHVHLDDRIGAINLADSFATGTEAAVRSGVTTVMSFVTQRAGESLLDAAGAAVRKAAGRSHCNVGFHLTPTRFQESDWADIERLVARGWHTFKFYTTYKEAGLYQSYDSLSRVLQRLAPLGVRVLMHCEDQDTLDHARDSVVDWSRGASYAQSRPPEAETVAAERIMELGARHSVPVHIVHVSAPETLDRIQSWWSKSDVSCETAPHYLLLSEAQLSGPNGHRFLCTPPLRSETRRSRLEQLAAQGAFDIFATDHCAFSRADKDRFADDVRRVPTGIAGIGALVPVMYDLLVTRHGKALSELVRRLSANPASVAGLYPRKGTLQPGADADIAVIAEKSPPRSVRSTLSDCYETYSSQTTTLSFRHVFVQGNEVVTNDELTDPTVYGGGVLCDASAP